MELLHSASRLHLRQLRDLAIDFCSCRLVGKTRKTVVQYKARARRLEMVVLDKTACTEQGCQNLDKASCAAAFWLQNPRRDV